MWLLLKKKRRFKKVKEKVMMQLKLLKELSQKRKR